MRIGLIQEDFIFGQVDQNYDIVAKAIKDLARTGADTLILPEMWSTYFSKEDFENTADLGAQRTRDFLSGLAKDLGVNIIGGSISEKDGDDFYNSSLVFNKDGEEITHYRKAHLYKRAGEDNYYRPGKEIKTFDLAGVKCGVCICHDISFPEWIRAYALAGVQVLFIPTGWPENGIENWVHLAKARAIENQIFIICANSTGTGSFKFGGRSVAVGPDGQSLLELGDKAQRSLVQIRPEEIEVQKDFFNLLAERRPDIY